MEKIKLKSYLGLYSLPVFILFSILVLGFQYNREKQYKADLLNTKLEDANIMLSKFLESVDGSIPKFDSLIALSPYANLRISLVDSKGKVLYDNVVKNVSKMENHLSRAEFVQAKKRGSGSEIRTSHTNKITYYYHVNRFGSYYVRSSLPYNMEVNELLSPNNLFLYFMLFLSFIIISVLFYLSNKLSVKMQREQIEHDATVRRHLTQQVAHELKTPLSSIIGYMETLQNNPNIGIEKQLFFIDRSYTQAVRLNDLLHDILTLNQLNEAPKTVEKEPFLLNKIIENVINDVSLKLVENNIHVETTIDGDIWIRANAMLVYSIFRNLMDNAIAYAGKNINIQIQLSSDDSKFYHFIFSDSGLGVDEKHTNYLFDRFYRVDKGRSRKNGGTGLGLAIVKNAIEFHGGKITVRNKEEGGLEFRFSIRK
ncbi:MAG: hypothetical protein AUK44_07470 [Porphyromonadaceae bacterium CG2_30_38_12]|nr:MAG: hypothetical protein AUK44_07470 [Porphyromonadaceae bacterium CG2_30_38_12]